MNKQGRLQFGVVKWFGGVNGTTGRENEFGFFHDLNGEDVFVHKRCVLGGILPCEGDVFVYSVEEQGGKRRAIAATRVREASLELSTVFKALLDTRGCTNSPTDLRRSLATQLAGWILAANQEQVRAVCAVDSIALFELIKQNCDSGKWAAVFAVLVECAAIDIFRDLPWRLIPPSVLQQQHLGFVAYIGSLDPDTARHKCVEIVDILPIDVVLYAAIEFPSLTKAELQPRLSDLRDLLTKQFEASAQPLPAYIREVYDTKLKPLGGYRASPLLWEMIEPTLFRRYLFQKNEKVFELYEASSALKTDLETFILFNLFSLFLSGNNTESVYAVFRQRLWAALVEEKFNLEDQGEALLRLFPSCHTLSSALSCEAVYWEKQDIYLCRGRKCSHPKVIPDPAKSWSKFNAYDWFSHYGVDFAKVGQPSKRDFPIKLAGYFNRLQEIYPLLHCRKCAKLLVPDFRYARTEYQDLEHGKAVTKQMAASYRLTVFHCNDSSCPEFEAGHYISHCLDSSCYDIVDSRDLKTKCDSGRYVCKGCGACCPTHAAANPVGLCPDCGASLEIFEAAQENQYGRRLRSVKCGAACGFTIASAELPQKFYLPSLSAKVKRSDSIEFEQRRGGRW